jgi:hypothetical protein
VIFQSFATYGWILIVVICILWWDQARKQAGRGEFRITWSLVISVSTLTFLYGVLLTVYATGSVPNVITSYGRIDNGCQATIDTTRLVSFRSDFHLVVACGIINPAMDQLEETGISISAPFNINLGSIQPLDGN